MNPIQIKELVFQNSAPTIVEISCQAVFRADFNGSETFGIQAIKPKAFLELIGDL